MELTNDRIRLAIAEPGTRYRKSRWDWTGWVTDVTLDGAHTFTVEHTSPGAGQGGKGFCNEFGIFQPVGFDDCPVGEHFPKLGVGLLRRPDDQAYRFETEYEIDPFEMKFRMEGNSVVFEVLPRECRGYAAHLVKTIELLPDGFLLRYELHNAGSRPIETHEYVHNFLALDAHPVGPDYRLDLSFPPTAASTPAPLVAADHSILVPHPMQSAFYGRPEGYAPGHRCSFTLRHLPSGLGMREETDFPLLWLALFGESNMICPEIFHDIRLAPGATGRWSRRYTFFQDPAR